MRTLPRRAGVFFRAGVGRFLLVLFLVEVFFAGRTGRDAAVFFLELRVRAVVDFFLDFFLEAVFEADFFRVTFFLASLRFFTDLPARVVAFFREVFFFDVFFPDVLFPEVFLLTFFLLEAFLAEAFLLDDFLLDDFLPAALVFLAAFFRLAFFDARTAGRFRDLRLAAFFETFFLVAAFFFGMRSIPGGFQIKAAIIPRRIGRGSPSGRLFGSLRSG